jgi:hypothetical protein
LYHILAASNKIIYTVHVARSAEMGAYNILVRRNQRKRPFRNIDVGDTIII